MKIIAACLTILLLCVTTKAQESNTVLKLSTSTTGSSFRITNSSDLVMMRQNGDAGFYLSGNYGTGTIPATGFGTRLMWYPAKAAFRAGYVNNTQWDDSNIGIYSAAIGNNTTANGVCSIAMGSNTTASGYCSTALGYETIASGDYSAALGYKTVASGYFSTALGYKTIASEYYSTAMGFETLANGIFGSTAMGFNTNASGTSSTAMGASTIASGNYSTVMGVNTNSQAYASFVLGRYNVLTGTLNNWVDTDPLFVCGNGIGSGSRSNALTLLKNGNMTIAGTLTQNSDIRLKKDIVPLNDVLKSIEKITPIYYNFKDTQTHPEGKQIGFSAQEIEKEFPELVTKDPDGYLSVQYANMTAVLLQAIKEQQEMIEQLIKENRFAFKKAAEFELKLEEQKQLLLFQTESINELQKQIIENKHLYAKVLSNKSKSDKLASNEN